MGSSEDNTESFIECNLSQSTATSDERDATFNSSMNTNENTRVMDIWREQMNDEKRRSEELQREFEQLKATVEAMQLEKSKLNEEIQKSKDTMAVIVNAFKDIRELVVGKVGQLVELSEQMMVVHQTQNGEAAASSRISNAPKPDIIPITVVRNNHQQKNTTEEIVDNEIEYWENEWERILKIAKDTLIKIFEILEQNFSTNPTNPNSNPNRRKSHQLHTKNWIKLALSYFTLNFHSASIDTQHGRVYWQPRKRSRVRAFALWSLPVD